MARLIFPDGKIMEINLNTSKVNNDLSITTERYIVFLDIMGFKDRVARTKHEELLSMLNDFNQKISQHILEHREHGIRLSQFSDSILIYSSDNKQSSLQTISEVSSKVMETAINLGIPLKGAIAKGVITCDISKQLYFGQALIDAYLLEENVKYYGILAHNSVEADIKSLEWNGLSLFRDIEAPLKSGTVSHFEICWYKNDMQTAKENLSKIRETVSGDPRKYIDNSLKVIDSFKV